MYFSAQIPEGVLFKTLFDRTLPYYRQRAPWQGLLKFSAVSGTDSDFSAGSGDFGFDFHSGIMDDGQIVLFFRG